MEHLQESNMDIFRLILKAVYFVSLLLFLVISAAGYLEMFLLFTRLHGVASHKIVVFIYTVVSNIFLCMVKRIILIGN
jgi:hypothetical protein